MSDVEDELLALAGGDLSESDDDAMGVTREDSPRSRSPTPAARSVTSSRSGGSNNNIKKGVSAKRRSSPPPPARKRQHARGGVDDADEDDDDDARSRADEGEASSAPGSPASQQSAPMDESDSDAESTPPRRAGDDDADQYPVDGLFKSYAERERIMGMREIEREQILAERREENERIRQNRMLRQLKVNQDKDNKKRKASAADLEDLSQRKPSRARTKVGETSEKMDTLRRAREERSSRKEQRERAIDARRKRSTSYQRNGLDHSDNEWGGHGSQQQQQQQRERTPEPKPVVIPPVELRDIERVRVGRSRFAEVCFFPGFQEALTGCFVRINIGPDPETQRDVYRMAVIKGFAPSKAYAVSDGSNQQMVVNFCVIAAHGKAQREWPFIMCSDRGFTEAEWNRYKQVCLAEGVPAPKRPALVKKIDDINKLRNRHWTENELSEKILKQRTLLAKYSGADRNSLARQMELARFRGDEAAVARYQARLDGLATIPRLAFGTKLMPLLRRSSPQAKDGAAELQERLALVNAENRRHNSEAIRQAQYRERHRVKQLQKERTVARLATAKLAAAITEGKVDADDNNNKNDGDPAGAASTPDKGKSAMIFNAIIKATSPTDPASKKIPVMSKPVMDDRLVEALDFDFEIEM